MRRAARGARGRGVPQVQTFFQSGSIIDAVLNFGLAAPIDVQLSGPDYDALHAAAQQVARSRAPAARGGRRLRPAGIRLSDARRRGRPGEGGAARPVPARRGHQRHHRAHVEPDDRAVDLDRSEERQRLLPDGPVPRAGHPARSTRCSTSPCAARASTATATRTRCCCATSPRSRATTQPAEAAHYNIQRVVDVLVSPRGDDMGGTQAAIQRALAGTTLPKDVQVTLPRLGVGDAGVVLELRLRPRDGARPALPRHGGAVPVVPRSRSSSCSRCRWG